MSGCIYGTATNKKPIPEWNVVSATADAQLVYAAGLPLTIVPLDSTTLVQLKDDERERLRAPCHAAHDGPREPVPPLARRRRRRG